jgi:hypothetical protein
MRRRRFRPRPRPCAEAATRTAPASCPGDSESFASSTRRWRNMKQEWPRSEEGVLIDFKRKLSDSEVLTRRPRTRRSKPLPLSHATPSWTPREALRPALSSR